MYLDYAKIKSGQRKQPMLRLRTLAGKELGAVPFVHDLKFCLNYSEVSTIEFTVPFKVNGMINPLYAALTSLKVKLRDTLWNAFSKTKTCFWRRVPIISGTPSTAKIPFWAVSLSLTLDGVSAMLHRA